MGETGQTGDGVETADFLGWSAAVALLVAITIEGILWTVTRVFILNFDIAGPNPTMLLFVLLSTGWILGVFARFQPSITVAYALSGTLLVIGFLGSLVPSPILSGVAAVVLVTAATPPLAGLCLALRERVVAGVAGGLLLTVGVRTVFRTAAPYATPAGTVVFGALVVAAAAMLVGFALLDRLPGTDWRAVGVTPAPLFVLLIVAAGYLGQPWTVARWALRSNSLSVVALVAGVLAGVGVVAVHESSDERELLGWAGLFLGGIAVVLVWGHPLTTAGLGAAWASALVLLAAGTRASARDEPTGEIASRSTRVVTGVQFLALFMLFLSTAATHWAFMPVPLSLTRGVGTEILLACHAVFPLAVALALRGSAPATPAVDQSRRSVLAAAPAAALPLGAVALTRRSPGVDGPRDGARVRVLSFNLHVFFEQGGAGGYNLGAVRDLIAEDGADVVAVSESDGLRPTVGHVDGLRWLGAELGYHTAFGGATSERSYGVGLLSRWPIEDVEVIDLPVEQSLTRLAVVARVQTPSGPLPVIGTHLSVGPESGSPDAQAEQVETIVDRASAFDRAAVMGDFNFEPDSEEYERLTGAFTDAWRAAEERSGTAATFSASDPEERIDYVFLEGEWTVHEAATKGTRSESDHKAVVAEIERTQNTGG